MCLATTARLLSTEHNITHDDNMTCQSITHNTQPHRIALLTLTDAHSLARSSSVDTAATSTHQSSPYNNTGLTNCPGRHSTSQGATTQQLALSTVNSSLSDKSVALATRTGAHANNNDDSVVIATRRAEVSLGYNISPPPPCTAQYYITSSQLH